MQVYKEEINVRGRTTQVSSVVVDNKVIIIAGNLFRKASIKDEWYENVDEPQLLIEKLSNGNLKADIFTFSQKFPETTPKYNYHMESDNVAAIPLKSFEHWWTKQIKDKTRNLVRKAERSGVSTKVSDYNDGFVKGISKIYDETPIRQGRPFWHYKKDFDTLKAIHSTFLDRSDFIGAYYNDELIGFIKLVYAGEAANIMHIISMIEHSDKAPTNALVAKAVEVTCKKGVQYLCYDKFDYGKTGSTTLANFKRHNGFERIDFPRYYVPLTIKGKMVLKMNLHHGLISVLPEGIIVRLLNLRNAWYTRKYRNPRKL